MEEAGRLERAGSELERAGRLKRAGSELEQAGSELEQAGRLMRAGSYNSMFESLGHGPGSGLGSSLGSGLKGQYIGPSYNFTLGVCLRALGGASGGPRELVKYTRQISTNLV